MKLSLRPFFFAFASCLTLCSTALADTARQIIDKAILAPNDAERKTIIGTLAGQVDESIATLFTAWKDDKLFVYTSPEGVAIPIMVKDDKDAAGTLSATKVLDGTPLVDATGQPVRVLTKDLKPVERKVMIRSALNGILDLQQLAAPDVATRLKVVETLGFSQPVDKLPALESRLAVEKDSGVLLKLREAIAVTKLKDPSDEVKLAAMAELKALHTFASEGLVKAAIKEAEEAKKPKIVEAGNAVLTAIESHRSFVDFFGTLFRGASSGSVLLIAALGLAITFGLMGVINMAHGEMIAVGAYTTYLVQNIFGAGITIPFFGWSLSLPGINATGGFYQTYFLFSLPLAFLAAAGVGILLERSVIRFLYSRPLESLLATWGVSLVLQQLFRMIFGSNNVQVSSPVYLSGNWTVNDILFGWNRVFVIGFAILIVFGTWLVLTKTSLGLLIRSVMQNRNMAACMGVRTDRVNMMTFGFGSGLAGLAGAFLSQITNVGPSLGQSYIVDCFMTVVVGGVGNLVGTVVSAVGIGMADQSLQQILLNPVMGKILVLVAIILFLQWRPAGIFVTRSRSLD